LNNVRADMLPCNGVPEAACVSESPSTCSQGGLASKRSRSDPVCSNDIVKLLGPIFFFLFDGNIEFDWIEANNL
jgi:hypothetical protein